ncbi:MAG: hypothetical protein QOJ02_1770 [Acidobacteriota bacterium]|jgi:hypothetical protein|nr:hypothetical protein [Acidobacteriota bacterium]
MFSLRKTSRRLSLLATCAVFLGLLLSPGASLNHSQLKIPGAVANASVSKSYVQFIIDAYIGAYGRLPDCSTETLPEYNRMMNAAASNTLLEECKRFVATLFETQASYNVPDYTTYVQTAEYEQRNSQYFTDFTHQQAFVTDLYHAFLQREPDADGLAFWTSNVMNETRKKGIIAFEVSIEFGDQVNLLYDGGPPDCSVNGDPGDPCMPGTHFYKKLC